MNAFSFVPVTFNLYKAFWKGFESDQRSLLNNIAGYQMRLLVWRVVNKQDAQVSSHVSNIVVLTINSRSPWEMISGFNLKVTRGEKRLFSLLMAVGGKLIVNNITNVRRNLSVLGRTIRKLMGGERSTKKYSRKEKLNEKNSCTQINPKKYSCYGLKKFIQGIW